MLHHRRMILALLLLLLTFPVVAQDESTCPAIVQSALQTSESVCSGTGRNQVCYGNILVDVDLQDGYDSVVFDGPGDIADMIGFQAVRLSPLDEAANQWGVALMKLQANLPDTLPGQNVTMLLFGDVQISSAVPLPTEVEVAVSAAQNINVRALPSTDSAVVGTLAPGESVIATGRLADRSWLRIRLADEATGWVFTTLLNAEGSEGLNVVTPGEAEYTPMQAFYFNSGIGDSPCQEAPESGILIQTPSGAGKVNLVINQVNISLGSTAYVQAQPGAALTISLIEGQATITAGGETQTVPSGTRVSVPLDETGEASGPPGDIEPYTEEKVASLPVGLLEREITIAAPKTAEEIAAFVAQQNVCRIQSDNQPNIRSGPGTAYPAIAEMSGTERTPLGQAIGTDGYVWYQTGASGWVREDVVEAAGNCDSLPVVTDLPPVPTAVPAPVVTDTPSSGSGNDSGDSSDNFGQFIYYKVNWCDGTFGQPIHAGMTVRFGYGIGRWPSVEETNAALAGHSGGIQIDGVTLPTNYTGVEWHTGDNADAGYGNGVYSDWIATAGSHTVNAWWTLSFATACQFVVE